uniref:RRM domain-containing protein n=1 Tax=Tetraodon nigroviridis TaxID=99883 RepID=H3C6B3_TETNG
NPSNLCVGSEKMPSADYLVGQVSGSLLQKNAAASAAPLSALFGSAAPATPPVFRPPPAVSPGARRPSASRRAREPVQRRTERPAPAEVRGQAGPCRRKNKLAAMASRAEQQAGGQVHHPSPSPVSREMGLQVADEDEQQKKSVFVGNLPVSCTKKMLQNLFKDEGSIQSIRFRSVVREDPSMSRKLAVIKRKIHPQKQSLNAYVVFKEEGGVRRALERNGLEIQKDFHIRVDRVGSHSSHDHKRSVFVGNLFFDAHSDVSELPFRRHFEECGSVEAVRLVRDQNSGLGKGFGYVLFESADAVQLALKLDGSKLEGRSIRVKRSLKKSENKAAQAGRAEERSRRSG